MIQFIFGDQVVEITAKYKYLRIYFSQSRSFPNARKHIDEQFKKLSIYYFYRFNDLQLPRDLQSKLFDHTVFFQFQQSTVRF